MHLRMDMTLSLLGRRCVDDSYPHPLSWMLRAVEAVDLLENQAIYVSLTGEILPADEPEGLLASQPQAAP
jgi:hypothetical protein